MLSPSALSDALRELGIESTPPARVLVVDDEPDNVEVLSALLEDEYTVEAAYDGVEALEIIENLGPVDLIISDQRMPRMTGVELLAKVAEQHPTTVGVLLTAYTDVEPMLAAVNRGDVYRFLLKPFDSAEMRQVVRDATMLKWTKSVLRQLIAALASQNKKLYETHMELANAQKKLLAAERLAALGRFASGIAHDVRNQLGIISLLMQLVQTKTDDASTLAASQRVRESSSSLLEVLECVRKLGRAAGMSGKPEEVEISQFVAETLAIYKKRHPVEAVRLVVNSSESFSLELQVEPIREALITAMRQALSDGTDDKVELRVRRRPSGPLCFEVAQQSSGTADPASGSDLVEVDPIAELELQLARLTTEAYGGRFEAAGVGPGDRTYRIFLQPPQEDIPMIASAHDMDAFAYPYAVERKLWVAPHAAAQLKSVLELLQSVPGPEDGPDGAWRTEVLEPTSDLQGPAVLLLSGADIVDPSSHPMLMRAARVALPGRPVVCGGTKNKDVLLSAINVWHAYRIVPDNVPDAATTDALEKAYEALRAEYSLDLAISEYREERKRLQHALGKLSEVEERVLQGNRLAVIGGATGALLKTLHMHLEQLDVFNELTASLCHDATLNELRHSAIDGFHATQTLLQEMAEFVQNKNAHYELEAQDLGLLVERAVAFCRFDPLARDRNLTLEKSSQVRIQADRYRLFHVIINLVRNALQATEVGSKVSVTVRATDDAAVIEVSDKGRGMPPEVLRQLFTPFFTTKSEGLGLGLHICRTVVERHGGQITCESEPGQGTRFRITLPISRSAN